VQVYPGLPVPSLLHYVAYEMHGFDSNYPDMLPPSPAFGSSCDMAETMAAAAALGHLTMPYFNPTWVRVRPSPILVGSLHTYAALSHPLRLSLVLS
jgi:hypothetical protein